MRICWGEWRGSGGYRQQRQHPGRHGRWYIDGTAERRLNLGVGRQIDVGTELRSCGASTDEAVFACAGVEVLDDDGDVLTLRDSAGTEVAELRYDDEDE